MPTDLSDAYRQWASRPPDERFSNLDELYSFTSARKNSSDQQIKFLDEISLETTRQGGLILNGNNQPAYLSNWAFSQICSMLAAPAKYLRTLPPDMVCKCLQYGLSNSNGHCKILIRDKSIDTILNSNRWASAFTSPSYGRIWDADVVENLMKAVEGSAWHPPHGRASAISTNRGLYASDRDMFAFMVNDENPIEVGDTKLGRGFFCWNSETGAATFGLTTFLYNYVCDNQVVFGAEEIRELKIFHRSHALDHFQTHAIPALNRFVENQSFGDNVKNSVSRAMDQPVGKDLEETLKWFRDKPFTKKEITDAWEAGNAAGEDVTKAWGMIQGLTYVAKDMLYIDKKVNLERRAGALLTI